MGREGADKQLKAATDRFAWPEVLAAVKAGANPNVKTSSGNFALAMACWYVELDTVRELLAHGANPNIGKGEPLKNAASTTSGDARPVFQLLLDHRVKLDFQHARFGNATALAIAIETGHPQIAEMLVKAGAALTIKADDGRTPLKVAKDWGFRKLVEVMTGRRSKGKQPAIDPFIETTYVERDYYEFAIGGDRRLSDLDNYDECNECAPGDYRRSKKATPIRIVPASKAARSNCGIFVGGQPSWAQRRGELLHRNSPSVRAATRQRRPRQHPERVHVRRVPDPVHDPAEHVTSHVGRELRTSCRRR